MENAKLELNFKVYSIRCLLTAILGFPLRWLRPGEYMHAVSQNRRCGRRVVDIEILKIYTCLRADDVMAGQRGRESPVETMLLTALAPQLINVPFLVRTPRSATSQNHVTKHDM